MTKMVTLQTYIKIIHGKKTINNDDLLASIIKGIEEVNDINILDLRDIDTSVCDYFVICNGNSNTQVNAIVNSIQKTVSKN
jgi:ribosome-associated protein